MSTLSLPKCQYLLSLSTCQPVNFLHIGSCLFICGSFRLIARYVYMHHATFIPISSFTPYVLTFSFHIYLHVHSLYVTMFQTSPMLLPFSLSVTMSDIYLKTSLEMRGNKLSSFYMYHLSFFFSCQHFHTLHVSTFTF